MYVCILKPSKQDSMLMKKKGKIHVFHKNYKLLLIIFSIWLGCVEEVYVYLFILIGII